jgi:molybdenum cofactor biosynthesis enzyme MoaA
MPTEDLSAVCRFAGEKFPGLQTITVYGSSQFVARKGAGALKSLKEAGLTRIHVGLESGDDEILKKVKKGKRVGVDQGNAFIWRWKSE